MKGTLKQIAAALSKQSGKEVDYNSTRGFVMVGLALGTAKEVGNAPRIEGAKGKPSKIYEVEMPVAKSAE